ncbi:MAG: biopolymer transporter ExbD [Deltaproteobacteria bacterium]|nr:biopolymer transporter ExbD [Deltaproteobacteria bacterium]
MVQADDSVPPGINQLPDPATFVAPPGSGKKKLAGTPRPTEPAGLSITSLMDVLTIILVFLLKSYSTNPVQLKQAKDLKLPFSSSELFPEESAAVTITLSTILVNDAPVLKIENGVVPESDRSSGGYLIDPLFQKLQEEVDHQKRIAKFNPSAEFKEICTIIADRHVPFTLLAQVMYTAGQATFSKFKFAVIKKSS